MKRKRITSSIENIDAASKATGRKEKMSDKFKLAVKNGIIIAILTPLWLLGLSLFFGLIPLFMGIGQCISGECELLKSLGLLCLMLAPVFGGIGFWQVWSEE